MNLEAEKLVYSASQLLEKEQAGEAASLLHDCILRYPDTGKAYAMLGYIYQRFFKEIIAGEEYFRKAMTLAPDFTDTYIYYADALLLQERMTEMTAILNKALATTGAEKNKIYYYFGMMNERLSKFEEAVENYQRAILFSLDDAEMDLYQKAVNRCLAKQKMYSL
jgi:Tfp pilus assembly protein PilF